jgi:hypothetical protein
MLFIVPPANKLAAARDLICSAIREPARIKAFDIRVVKLADKKGDIHALQGVDLAVWHNMVVPYFVQSQAAGQASESSTRKERKLTASERKYIEPRRREVLEIEKKIEEERKALEAQRRAMEARSAEIGEAEQRATEAVSKAGQIDTEALEKSRAEQEARFAEREREIADLRRQLEEERKDLAERTAYVTSVEESLVNRLNELSTREASIEQGEINAGLRRDS